MNVHAYFNKNACVHMHVYLINSKIKQNNKYACIFSEIFVYIYFNMRKTLSLNKNSKSTSIYVVNMHKTITNLQH